VDLLFVGEVDWQEAGCCAELAAAASPASRFTSPTTTRAPSRTNRRTASLPMLVTPPAKITRLPSSRPAIAPSFQVAGNGSL